jgi:hypothetical protein
MAQADVAEDQPHVRFGPEADIPSSRTQVCF